MLHDSEDSEEIIERVAALDLGKAELVACVRVPNPDRPGRRSQEITTYSTMTRALLVLADLLRELAMAGSDRRPAMTEQSFEEYTHEPMVHDHEHWHVTHNWSETAGTFEHLAARHSHEHDHAGLTHAHVPHVDFDSEHAGEAHVHNHDQPVDSESK